MSPIRLGDCCLKIGSGSTPRGGKEVYLTSGEYTLIRSQNIHNWGFNPSGLVFLSSEQAQKLDSVTVEPEDVLLNITGDSVARVCQVPEDVLPARVNQHVAIIRPDPDTLNPKFLRFYLTAPSVQQNMLALAAAGATRNALTKGMIESFVVPDVSLETQEAIAFILGSLESKIALNQRMNNTLQELTSVIFDHWFARRAGNIPSFEDIDINDEILDGNAVLSTTTYKESELGMIPQDWTVCAFGDIADILNGFAFKSTDYITKDGVFVLRTKNFADSGFAERLSDDVFLPRSFMQSHEKYLCQPFDFYVVMVGASLGQMSMFLPHLSPALQNQNMWCFRPKPNIAGKFFIDFMARKAVSELAGWASGSAREFLKKEDFRKLRVAMPPQALIDNFEAIAKKLYSVIALNAVESETLASLREMLLAPLISGQLSVNNCRGDQPK